MQNRFMSHLLASVPARNPLGTTSSRYPFLSFLCMLNASRPILVVADRKPSG